MKTVAVIDIGKTTAKVALVDLDRFEEIAVRKTANSVVPGGLYPHFDVERIWRFILESLAALNAETRIDALSVTTHGATAALLDRDGGLALPVLDYEFEGPQTLAKEYGRVRPAFSETGSPRLAAGLNLGAQLFWQQRQFPGLFANVACILPYPQYWSYRLTGVAASEVTSLGSHTDLWNPARKRFSTLVERQGWAPLFPPLRRASDRLGGLSAAVAKTSGLAEGLPVTCGIHDSNASLLPHILTRTPPFSVVSTGTWVIVMAIGAENQVLDEARDTLVNVNALGDPIPSARFMGGRTFAMLVKSGEETGSREDEVEIVSGQSMLLPMATQGAGPFPNAKGLWTCDEEQLTPGARAVVVSFHLALMTATCLDLIGAEGDIVVEGSFTGNSAYLRMLSAAAGRAVLTGSASVTGTSLGTACLADGMRAKLQATTRIFETGPDYDRYASLWREKADRGSSDAM